jgi:hypothetical protein
MAPEDDEDDDENYNSGSEEDAEDEDDKWSHGRLESLFSPFWCLDAKEGEVVLLGCLRGICYGIWICFALVGTQLYGLSCCVSFILVLNLNVCGIMFSMLLWDLSIYYVGKTNVGKCVGILCYLV